MASDVYEVVSFGSGCSSQNVRAWDCPTRDYSSAPYRHRRSLERAADWARCNLLSATAVQCQHADIGSRTDPYRRPPKPRAPGDIQLSVGHGG